jgi:hypothetical protein
MEEKNVSGFDSKKARITKVSVPISYSTQKRGLSKNFKEDAQEG